MQLNLRLSGTATFSLYGREQKLRVTTQDISAYRASLVSETSVPAKRKVKLSLKGVTEPDETPVIFEAKGSVLKVDRLAEGRFTFEVKFSEVPRLTQEG